MVRRGFGFFVITVGMMTPLVENFYGILSFLVPSVMDGDAFPHLQGRWMSIR